MAVPVVQIRLVFVVVSQVFVLVHMGMPAPRCSLRLVVVMLIRMGVGMIVPGSLMCMAVIVLFFNQ